MEPWIFVLTVSGLFGFILVFLGCTRWLYLRGDRARTMRYFLSEHFHVLVSITSVDPRTNFSTSKTFKWPPGELFTLIPDYSNGVESEYVKSLWFNPHNHAAYMCFYYWLIEQKRDKDAQKLQDAWECRSYRPICSGF